MKLKFITIIFLLIPILALAQDNTKKKAYYFYGEQCPHCKNVDEYFQANGIYDKYEITKLDFSNPFNARLLMKFGEAFDNPYKGSVPAIAFDDRFLVGDTPIIENFEKEIDAADAYSLPDPDKIGKNSGSESQKSENNPAPAGNKKNYFPVILIALAVVGGGALVYVNLKKT